MKQEFGGGGVKRSYNKNLYHRAVSILIFSWLLHHKKKSRMEEQETHVTAPLTPYTNTFSMGNKHLPDKIFFKKHQWKIYFMLSAIIIMQLKKEPS